jgi:hypothetical protein
MEKSRTKLHKRKAKEKPCENTKINEYFFSPFYQDVNSSLENLPYGKDI